MAPVLFNDRENAGRDYPVGSAEVVIDLCKRQPETPGGHQLERTLQS